MSYWRKRYKLFPLFLLMSSVLTDIQAVSNNAFSDTSSKSQKVPKPILWNCYLFSASILCYNGHLRRRAKRAQVTMFFCVPFYTFEYLLYLFVPFCTFLYLFVPFCTFLFLFVPFCTFLYLFVTFCNFLYLFVPFCTFFVYICLPLCTFMYHHCVLFLVQTDRLTNRLVQNISLEKQEALVQLCTYLV